MIDLGRRRPLLLVLAILLIFSCLQNAAWAETASLPARDWNLHNLQRLQALKSDTVTFAVFGDNRDNFPVLKQLLRKMSHEPELKFAIHLGDLVDKGELARYRRFFQSVPQNLPMPLLAVIGNHELAGDPEGKLYTGIFGPGIFPSTWEAIISSSSTMPPSPARMPRRYAGWKESCKRPGATRPAWSFSMCPSLTPGAASTITACRRRSPGGCRLCSNSTGSPASLRAIFIVTLRAAGTAYLMPLPRGPGPSCMARTRNISSIIILKSPSEETRSRFRPGNWMEKSFQPARKS